MEQERIKPGKPMDDATFLKYLRQNNIPINFQLKGKIVVAYDIRFIIKAVDQRFGGSSYMIQFGNYFHANPDVSSLYFSSGKPFKTEAPLLFTNSTTYKEQATAIEISPNEAKFKVKIARSDTKRIALQFLQTLKEVGQTVPRPLKLGASIVIDCSLRQVKDKPYLIIDIDNVDRNESEGETPSIIKRKNYNQTFVQNIRLSKTTPDTDILTRIDKGTPTQAFFKELITPIKAEDMLMRNLSNRHVRLEDVYDYAQQREAGRWKWTNQSTVGFDKKGKLIDGQHKLLSQIKAGVEAHMVIFTGLDEDAFEVIDAGRRRNVGDTLSVEGISNANQAAAVASFIINYEKFNNFVGKQRRISNHDIRAWIKDERNKRKLYECLSFHDTTLRKYGSKLLVGTIWAGMLFILSDKKKSEAEYFLEKLATGEDQSRTENSPIFYLRKLYEKWDKMDLPQRGKSTHAKVVAMIEAWNAFRQKDGRDRPLVIDKLRFDPEQKELPKISR